MKSSRGYRKQNSNTKPNSSSPRRPVPSKGLPREAGRIFFTVSGKQPTTGSSSLSQHSTPPTRSSQRINNPPSSSKRSAVDPPAAPGKSPKRRKVKSDAASASNKLASATGFITQASHAVKLVFDASGDVLAGFFPGLAITKRQTMQRNLAKRLESCSIEVPAVLTPDNVLGLLVDDHQRLAHDNLRLVNEHAKEIESLHKEMRGLKSDVEHWRKQNESKKMKGERQKNEIERQAKEINRLEEENERQAEEIKCQVEDVEVQAGEIQLQAEKIERQENVITQQDEVLERVQRRCDDLVKSLGEERAQHKKLVKSHTSSSANWVTLSQHLNAIQGLSQHLDAMQGLVQQQLPPPVPSHRGR